ncbi:MAG: DUF4041 domain-containing protein [Kofleriaceae bacterium]|nr:DUF4041 domain-containing protein [Kofleriaceae bacterium]
MAEQVRALQARRDALRQEVRELEALVTETRDAVLMQEVGLFRYAHPLETSAEYKAPLTDIQAQMAAMAKRGEAITEAKTWVINGSEKEGAKLVSSISKLMLRAYNTEADSLVKNLKPFALGTALNRLEKLNGAISKFGLPMKIRITERYHMLRMRELRLTADYLMKLAEEREQEKEHRARLKEEETARREYEREQARLEKERSHYEAALAALRAKGDEAGVAETADKLTEIQQAIEGVERRAANVRDPGSVKLIHSGGVKLIHPFVQWSPAA